MDGEKDGESCECVQEDKVTWVRLSRLYTKVVDRNVRQARSQRTYSVASIPRSANNLSSGKVMLSGIHPRGQDAGAGGDGFLLLTDHWMMIVIGVQELTQTKTCPEIS